VIFWVTLYNVDVYDPLEWFTISLILQALLAFSHSNCSVWANPIEDGGLLAWGLNHLEKGWIQNRLGNVLDVLFL